MPGHENARVITYFSYYNPQPVEEDLRQLVHYLADGNLVSPDQSVMPFADATTGLAALGDRKIHGKLVLTRM